MHHFDDKLLLHYYDLMLTFFPILERLIYGLHIITIILFLLVFALWISRGVIASQRKYICMCLSKLDFLFSFCYLFYGFTL